MIYFLTKHATAYTLPDLLESKIQSRVAALSYEEVFRRNSFVGGTYVFSDIDRLDYTERERASQLYLWLKHEGFRVLNNPARVKTRYPLLRALHQAGLNRFQVYDAEHLGDVSHFPVFIRSRHEHGRPLPGLLSSPEELQSAWEQAVEQGIPEEHLVAIEYAGEPVRPGVFRKLSAFKVGGRIFSHNTGHDSEWLVKTGRIGVAEDAEYEHEESLLRDNPYRELMEKVFAVARIDYGRADFGLCEGVVQVFEINTNPQILYPRPHPNAIRCRNLDTAFELYLDAVAQSDTNPDDRVRFWPESQGGPRSKKKRTFPQNVVEYVKARFPFRK